MSKHWLVFIGLVILLCCTILLFCGFTNPDEYDGSPIWTNKMIAAHEAAETLRAAGYSEDSEAIQALSQAWWSEYHDLCIVAKVIEGEAGGCGYEQMVYTGVTVVNRAKSGKFHYDTIEEIVAAPGQYSLAYLENFHTIQPRVWLAAKDAMDGNHDAPDDLYWEALFPQGKEIWKIIKYESRWYCSTTYFCRGTIYD